MPSTAGSVVIWYCNVYNSPVGTQERDRVESVVPFSVTLGHGGRPSLDKIGKSFIFKYYMHAWGQKNTMSLLYLYA